MIFKVPSYNPKACSLKPRVSRRVLFKTQSLLKFIVPRKHSR
jgi:hypothetical protein